MEKSSNNLARFSYFEAPIQNVHPSKNVTLVDVYHYIKDSKEALVVTRELRSKTDIKEARKFKSRNFDYCTFSGIFTSRSEKDLVTHSGLICLDFDHLKNLEEVRQWLLNDDYFDTQLLFTSPSGDGLKWIVEIDLTKASHLDYFLGIQNYLKLEYGLDIDPSGKDICRACFLPHDPNCYINPQLLKV